MVNDINDSYINTNEYNRKNSLAHSLLMGCHVIGLSTSATPSVMKDGLRYSQVFLSRFSCASYITFCIAYNTGDSKGYIITCKSISGSGVWCERSLTYVRYYTVCIIIH